MRAALHYVIAGCALLSVAGLLAACSTGGAAAGRCPKIGVLPDAADMPIVNAQGKTVALARLSVANGPCIYDKSRVNSTGYSKVSFPLTVRVAVAQVEGSLIDSVDVEYIIATVTVDGALTGRASYRMSVGIDGKTGSDDDRVMVTIPYAGNGDAASQRVVAALAVDRDTVQWNRTRLGR